jgi:(p)ppGpp synthase/HD superfamily hydrolase
LFSLSLYIDDAVTAELLQNFNKFSFSKSAISTTNHQLIGRNKKLMMAITRKFTTSPLAQTNIQLYGQLEASGYSEEEIGKVARAYRISQKLFTAMFRGSGRPFLCHLVGTASILARDRASATEVTAALLHAAYASGSFPMDTQRAGFEAKREWIRKEVGEETEALIYDYHRFSWNSDALKRLANETTPELLPILRLRLANELDDLADNGIRYSGSAKSAMLDNCDNRELLALLAGRVGLPHLEHELSLSLENYGRINDRHVIEETVGRDFSYILLPPVATERLSFRFGKFSDRVKKRITRLFSR